MKEKIFDNKGLYIILSVLFIIMLIGFSYAYFNAKIEGKGNDVNVSAGYKELTISDNNAVSFGTITPGWSQAITFSVTNTGSLATYYNLIWADLINELSRTSDLTVNITSTNSGGTATNLAVPSTGDNQSILKDIKIEPNVTQTYTLTFNYANLDDVDQSIDSNKNFLGHLGISPSSKK